MKKLTKVLMIITLFLIVIAVVLVSVAIPKYQAYTLRLEEEKEQERIKNATIKVELIPDLNIAYGTNVKLSYFIQEINGKLIDDPRIFTNTIGKRTISFNYINDEDIEVSYSFDINIIDNTPPVIWLNNTYTVYTTYDGNLVEDITCADDFDDAPKCTIEGEYNTKQVGNYDLVYRAEDNFGNVTTKNFTLRVLNPPSGGGGGSSTPKELIDLQEIIKEHKNENTKIGMDVSRWQGDIDYDAVKAAGIEFVIIKVGGTTGVDSDEYYVDRKFKENIEGFNRVGIPVGVYIYTYARTKEQAERDARWIIEQIKDYDVQLPIVYDWENWSFFNEFHQSFYTLTKNAEAFFRVVEKAGYEGMLYGSKNYLANAWFPVKQKVWVAQYYNRVTYEGRYEYWQLTSSGRVPGIGGATDIDIMYIK